MANFNTSGTIGTAGLVYPTDNIFNVASGVTINLPVAQLSSATGKLVKEGEGTLHFDGSDYFPLPNGFNIKAGVITNADWFYYHTAGSADLGTLDPDFFRFEGGDFQLHSDVTGSPFTDGSQLNRGFTIAGDATISRPSSSSNGILYGPMKVLSGGLTYTNAGTGILDLTGGYNTDLNETTYSGTGEFRVGGTITVPSTATGVTVATGSVLNIADVAFGGTLSSTAADYYKTQGTGLLKFSNTKAVIPATHGITVPGTGFNVEFGDLSASLSNKESANGSHEIHSPIVFSATNGSAWNFKGNENRVSILGGATEATGKTADDTSGFFITDPTDHTYIYPQSNINLPNSVLDTSNLSGSIGGMAFYQQGSSSEVTFNKIINSGSIWYRQEGASLDHRLNVNEIASTVTTAGFISNARSNIWNMPATFALPTSGITFGTEFGGQFTRSGTGLTYPDATIIRATGTITAILNSWYQSGTRTTKTVIEVNENSYGRFVSTGTTDSFADGPLEFEVNENLTSSATIFGSNIKLLDNQSTGSLNSGVGFDTPTVTGTGAGSFSVPTLSISTSGDTNDILLNATHVAPVNEVQTVSYTWRGSGDNNLDNSSIDIGILPGNRFLRISPTNALYRNTDNSVDIDAINDAIKALVEANTNKLTFIGTTLHSSNPSGNFSGSSAGYDGNLYLTLQAGITEADIPMTGTISIGGLNPSTNIDIRIPYTSRTVNVGTGTIALAVDSSVLTGTIITTNPAPEFRNVLLVGDAQGPDWTVTAASVSDLVQPPMGAMNEISGNLVFTARSAGNKDLITFASQPGAAAVTFGTVTETTAGAGVSNPPALLTTSYNAPTSNVSTVSEGGSFTITATGNLITDGTTIPYTISGLQAADFTGNNNTTKIQEFTWTSGSGGTLTTPTFTITRGDGITETITGDTSINAGESGAITSSFARNILRRATNTSTVISSGNTLIVTFTEAAGDATIALTTPGATGQTLVADTSASGNRAFAAAGSLTGMLTYNSNSATQTFTIVNDKVFSESESFIFTLNSPASGSVTVPITDTTFDVQTIKYTGNSVNTSGTPTSITLYKPDNTSETVSGITTSTSFANAITAVVNAINIDSMNYGTVVREDSFGSTNGSLYFGNFATGITQAAAITAFNNADVADIVIGGVSLTTLIPGVTKNTVTANGGSEVNIPLTYSGVTVNSGRISGISNGNSIGLAEDLDYSATSGSVTEAITAGTVRSTTNTGIVIETGNLANRISVMAGINGNTTRSITVGGVLFNNIPPVGIVDGTGLSATVPSGHGIEAGQTVTYPGSANLITITYTANNPTRQWAIKADNGSGNGTLSFDEVANSGALTPTYSLTPQTTYIYNEVATDGNNNNSVNQRINEISSGTFTLRDLDEASGGERGWPAIGGFFVLGGFTSEGATATGTIYQYSSASLTGQSNNRWRLSGVSTLDGTAVTLNSTDRVTPVFQNNPSVNEGANQIISLTTTGLANGTCVPYTITTVGADAADLGLSNLTGNFVVGTTNSITITPAADMTTESVAESFTLALDSVGGLIPTTTTGVITINDTSKTPAAVGNISITTSESNRHEFNEGTSTSFTFDVANFAGTDPTINLIQEPSGLSHTVTNNGGTTTRIYTVNLNGNNADVSTDDNFQVRISLGGTNTDVYFTLKNVPPVYTLSNNVLDTTAEGTSFTITLGGTNLPNTGTLAYTVRTSETNDVSAADFTSGSLTGNFDLSSDAGKTISFTLAHDILNEGDETFFISLDSDSTINETVTITNVASNSSDHTVPTGGSTVEVPAGTTTDLSGVVSGDGNITKTGTGRLILRGNNTFTGNVVVNGGIIEIVDENSLGDSTEVQLANNTTLLNNATSKIAINPDVNIRLVGNTTIENSNGTMDILSRLHAGTGSASTDRLTLNGTGTIRVRGDNDYNNHITVSKGITFDVNDRDYTNTGSHTAIINPSTLTINGDLRGKGIINGPVTMAAGSRLLPGAEVGSRMVINGNLTLNSGSATYVSFTEAGGDTLQITNGTLTLGGALNLVSYTTNTTGNRVVISTGTGGSINTSSNFDAMIIPHQNPDGDFTTPDADFRDSAPTVTANEVTFNRT